jgi:hypothetical protein
LLFSVDSLFFFVSRIEHEHFRFQPKLTPGSIQNKPKMISNFFVLSPRGDTILAKQYRTTGVGAHERSHTEAFFRKIKFWNDEQDHASTVGTIRSATTNSSNAMTMNGGGDLSTDAAAATETQQQQQHANPKKTGDAPPVFLMPDGLTYFHVKRNGLIFGASSARNVSPNTVLEVRPELSIKRTLRCVSRCCTLTLNLFALCNKALVHDCANIQGLLWNVIGRSLAKEFYFVL